MRGDAGRCGYARPRREICGDERRYGEIAADHDQLEASVARAGLAARPERGAAEGEAHARGELPPVTEEFIGIEVLEQEKLTFVVIGAGPTGVELCGELRDFVAQDAPRLYECELLHQLMSSTSWSCGAGRPSAVRV